VISGNRISIAVGVLIAGVGTRFLEDGNLLVTSVITLFCATTTRLTWELIKKMAARGN
jgi:hypothetical protein